MIAVPELHGPSDANPAPASSLFKGGPSAAARTAAAARRGVPDAPLGNRGYARIAAAGVFGSGLATGPARALLQFPGFAQALHSGVHKPPVFSAKPTSPCSSEIAAKVR